LFNGQQQISIVKNPGVMFGEMGSVIANNYKEMFSHILTKN
jgi:hypothetical protein